VKVAITGHMSGLGKSLYSLFDDVLGFDLNNGFDIRNPLSIVEQAKSCDVFINNAYHKFSQVDLLELMFTEWKNESKTIVNISSLGADATITSLEPFGFYPIHKRALDDATTRLQYIAGKCRIINIKPGWIDTPMVAEFNTDKLDPDQLALDIKDVIISNKAIRSITLGNLDYKR
jgi:NAD(P)-dependent dehydrogenase (short-subunit alcohol dehydrogenase family)